MKLDSVFFSGDVFGFCFSGLLLTLFFFIYYLKKESLFSVTGATINECLVPENVIKS